MFNTTILTNIIWYLYWAKRNNRKISPISIHAIIFSVIFCLYMQYPFITIYITFSLNLSNANSYYLEHIPLWFNWPKGTAKTLRTAMSLPGKPPWHGAVISRLYNVWEHSLMTGVTILSIWGQRAWFPTCPNQQHPTVSAD